MHLVAAILCFAGFAALALATERQQTALLGHRLARGFVRRLRIGGAGLLLAALALLVAAHGWALGLVSYSGHTSLAAGGVFCALVIAGRRRARRVA